MWIKNKTTGLTWEIVNKSQIDQLLKDANYVESRKSTAEKKTDKKEA